MGSEFACRSRAPSSSVAARKKGETSCRTGRVSAGASSQVRAELTVMGSVALYAGEHEDKELLSEKTKGNV